MSPQTFAIRLNKFPAVYQPGETIVGEVLLELKRPETCRGVSLRFKGRARLRWTENRGAGKNRRSVEYIAEENYFLKEVYVTGSSSGQIELVAGQHIFPFTFPLPNNIPSSFEHEYGRVEYNVKAVMDVAWAIDDKTYLPFTIHSPLELLHSPSNPIQDDVHEDYCCCLLPCISRGFMEAQILIPGDAYDIGERLEVFVDMNVNSKSVDILAIELHLKQRLEFYAQGKTKSKTETVQKAVKSGPFPGTSSVKIGLQVPSVLHSGFPHCSIMNIIYQLGVRLVVSDCHCDTKKDYEIKIGSKSQDALASPTAPMVELPMPGTLSNSHEPAPPIGFRISAPSAPMESTDTLPPPPSYESVMAQEGKK